MQVLQVGRSYFGCSNLSFVPLENNGKNGSARYAQLSSLVHVCMHLSVCSEFAGCVALMTRGSPKNLVCHVDLVSLFRTSSHWEARVLNRETMNAFLSK